VGKIIPCGASGDLISKPLGVTRIRGGKGKKEEKEKG